MTISNIVVNGNTYTDADWRANWEGTISAIANDIAAAVAGAALAGGTLFKSIAPSGVTLTAGESDNRIFIFTGALTANAGVTFAASFEGLALVVNDTTGGFDVPVALFGGGASVTVKNGQTALVYCDGTDFSFAVGVVNTSTGAKVDGTFEATGAVTVGGALAVTGATTAAALTLTGTLTGVTATFSGALTAASLTTTDNIAIGGAAGVTGAVSAGSLAVADGATINGTGTVLQIAAASGEIRASLSTLSTAPAYFEWSTTGIPTWVAGRDNTAQTGGNSGGNWILVALNDSGSPIGTAVKVYRDTMEFNLPNLPTSAAGLRTGSLWSDAGTLKVA